MFKNLTKKGRIVMFILFFSLLVGGIFLLKDLMPRKIKKSAEIKSEINVPPLAYDKDANAVYKEIPEFNEPSDKVDSKEIRGEIMGWNGQLGLLYAVGGKNTSVGSLAEAANLNIKLDVQNSCMIQSNRLYEFAQALAEGNNNPTSGIHFTAWMGDGVHGYLDPLNELITKELGPEYTFQVMMFGGASFGEDKWLLTPKYKKDPRGSLTVTVKRDGDWNIAILNCKQKGIPVNNDEGTYDPDAANFIEAPNSDYMQSSSQYVAGKKVTLRLVKNGKDTGRDTTIAITGVATWFPADKIAVEGRGGLVTAASTKDYSSQMATAFIFNKFWAEQNKDLMIKFCEIVGEGGNQVKSHDRALTFATEIAEIVFADPNLTAKDWYNGYKGYSYTDDLGNEVEIGGSRVFNLADAANYVGITGGGDKYKSVFETFGNILLETYPELFPTVATYEESVNFEYLRVAYTKNKATAGSVSTPTFTKGDRITETFAKASYSIEFSTGSATIKPESFKLLNDLADQLTISENLMVEISGHTDNIGSDDVNIPLSKARAEAVVNYLTNRNPDLSSRISFYGYGSKKPLDPTANQDNATVRALNRRVEIKLGR